MTRMIKKKEKRKTFRKLEKSGEEGGRVLDADFLRRRALRGNEKSTGAVGGFLSCASRVLFRKMRTADPWKAAAG